MALIYLFIETHGIHWNPVYLFLLAWLSNTYDENAAAVDYFSPGKHGRLLTAAVDIQTCLFTKQVYGVTRILPLVLLSR